MVCKCIKEIEDNLKKRYEAKADIENITNVNVSLENTALMFNDGPVTIELSSPVKIEYDYTNKKGEIKHKKEKANMAYRYCPFCGKPYREVE